MSNKARKNREGLKDILKAAGTLVIPGAHDPVSAMLIAEAGFPAVYVGSYATSAARFGLPDVGAVTLDEMVSHARAIADAVDVPVLADAENGWNNAANIWRTIRGFEEAGISAIHIEDHEFGKHLPTRVTLSPLEIVLGKIRAAVDAREDPNFLIIGRTDAAYALDDLNEAVRRMNAFLDAGADLVMPAGIDPRALCGIREQIRGQVVITDTPGRSIADENAAGANIVLYYGFSVVAAYSGVKAALASFKTTNDADQVPQLRSRVEEFERFIGYPEFVTRARKYGVIE